MSQIAQCYFQLSFLFLNRVWDDGLKRYNAEIGEGLNRHLWCLYVISSTAYFVWHCVYTVAEKCMQTVCHRAEWEVDYWKEY